MRRAALSAWPVHGAGVLLFPFSGGTLRAPALLARASHLACSSVVSRLPGREPGVPSGPGTLPGRPRRAPGAGSAVSPPVCVTLRSTRLCKSPPTPRGSSAPPARCRAGVRASAVQPSSIGSAVAVGPCPVSRRPPSIPPSFRRSPVPRRRPPARPSAEPKLFGSGENASQPVFRPLFTGCVRQTAHTGRQVSGASPVFLGHVPLLSIQTWWQPTYTRI